LFLLYVKFIQGTTKFREAQKQLVGHCLGIPYY